MTSVCFSAATIYYSQGGEHFWVYLNWALGLKKNDCEVIWLEKLNEDLTVDLNRDFIDCLKNN